MDTKLVIADLEVRVEADLKVLAEVHDYLTQPILNFQAMLRHVRKNEDFPFYPLEKLVDLFEGYNLNLSEGFAVFPYLGGLPSISSRKYQKLSEDHFNSSLGVGIKTIRKSDTINLAGKRFYVGTGRVRDPIFVFFNQGNLYLFDQDSKPINYSEFNLGSSNVSYNRPKTTGKSRLFITKIYYSRFDKKQNSKSALNFMHDMWYNSQERFNNYGLRLLVRGFMDGYTDVAGNFHLAHLRYEIDDLGEERRKDVKVFYVDPSFSEKKVRFSWRGPYIQIRNEVHSLVGASNLSPYPGILTSRPDDIENLQEVIAIRNLDSLKQNPKMRVNCVEYIFSADEIKYIVKKHKHSQGLGLFLYLDKGSNPDAQLLINNGDKLEKIPIQYRLRGESFPDKAKIRRIKSAPEKREKNRLRKAFDEFDASENYVKAEEHMKDLWFSSPHLFDGAYGRTILLEASLDTIVSKDRGDVPFSHYEHGVQKKFYVGKKHKGQVTVSWRGPYVLLQRRGGNLMQAYERDDYGFEVTGAKSLKELVEAVQIRNIDSIIQPGMTINNIKYKFSTPELREYTSGLTVTQMAFMGHVFNNPSQSEFYFLVKTDGMQHIFPIQTVRYTEKRKK